jgi:hypothetical protein
VKAFALAAAAVALAGIGCSDRRAPHAEPPPPDPHTRRVIEPPTGTMRPLPPHAIRADGVGPYKLGAQLESILAQLPSGPRIAQYDIPGVGRYSLIRAEDDAVLVGGEPRGAVSFVAVVGGEVARTESGVHVGSSRDELVRALGPLADDVDHARDPRLVAPTGIAGLRAIIGNDHVVALVVSAGGDPPRRASPPPVTPASPAPAADGDCARPAPTAPNQLGACLATGELVTTEAEELVVRAPDNDKPLARQPVPGLVFAAALRAGDRDELVAITRTDDGQQRTWSLVAFRLEAGHLVRAIEPTQLYQLTSANARWIGAELHDLDLYLELASRPDAIEVGGLLATRVGDKLRDVLVISTPTFARRKPHPAQADGDASIPEPTDAGSAHRPLPAQ